MELGLTFGPILYLLGSPWFIPASHNCLAGLTLALTVSLTIAGVSILPTQQTMLTDRSPLHSSLVYVAPGTARP